MKFTADLHVHSKFSRATSRDMTLDSLAYWSKVKGISLVATGDFTHPEWLFLCKDKLQPLGNGFFQLKKTASSENEYLKNIALALDEVSFILSTEISFIYSKIGNLKSDGLPILGLDAKEFVKIVANHTPDCVVIPAHIWTPWFSLFGANSGFDDIEECFEEMTPFIFALETGLSSNPAMNWRLPQLDKYTLISNSDAHSPSKIGREANVFNTEFSFKGLMDTIKNPSPEKFLYTIEFFPEEGKYHYDGHRKCKIVLSPQETIQHHYLCPQCGKKLTVGVQHRVNQLAKREAAENPALRIPYKSLIPLNEIIGLVMEKSSNCKSVWNLYFSLIQKFGNEHEILTETPISELIQTATEHVGRISEQMRKGQISISPGYDGTFGKISFI